MRKFLFIFLILCLAFLLIAGDKKPTWNIFMVYELTEVFWSIQGTEIKYSNPFETNGYMNLYFNFGDTSGTDSTALRAKFYMRGISGWICQDSLDISSDSTEVGWKITNLPVDASDSAQVSIEGLAGNKKLSGVLGNVKYKGCY